MQLSSILMAEGGLRAVFPRRRNNNYSFSPIIIFTNLAVLCSAYSPLNNHRVDAESDWLNRIDGSDVRGGGEHRRVEGMYRGVDGGRDPWMMHERVEMWGIHMEMDDDNSDWPEG